MKIAELEPKIDLNVKDEYKYIKEFVMEKHVKFEKALEAYMELQKPIYHIPINLGINMFKKEARAAGLKKSFTNKLIAAYKKRSWMEYKGVARYRGTFPTHPQYGSSVEVKIVESETAVNVRTSK